MMDSLTRFAMAQRDRSGGRRAANYTRLSSSMFALMPKLVERAGRSAEGSITALYGVGRG